MSIVNLTALTAKITIILGMTACNVVRIYIDRLCGLVVRVSGYRYRGFGFDSQRYQIF